MIEGNDIGNATTSNAISVISAPGGFALTMAMSMCYLQNPCVFESLLTGNFRFVAVHLIIVDTLACHFVLWIDLFSAIAPAFRWRLVGSEPWDLSLTSIKILPYICFVVFK